MKNQHAKFTVVGTDIEEVKRLNANSGMSYNELNEWFAQKMQSESTKSFKESIGSKNK
ncbi:hypothetical protein [Bacillus sp. FJAT-22090]|uniref:hypothetical protein n=1 Tax=Bacillus sp. FJAT-22090 TaxID=1581038 RepID=UPI0011A231F5|nr:hypothetical protein [Bacillus sp. FJAT-22090]